MFYFCTEKQQNHEPKQQLHHPLKKIHDTGFKLLDYDKIIILF
jgi:hypothetical protein